MGRKDTGSPNIADNACMKMLEIKCEKGNFQALDEEKLFNKEGLKDTLHIREHSNITGLAKWLQKIMRGGSSNDYMITH